MATQQIALPQLNPGTFNPTGNFQKYGANTQQDEENIDAITTGNANYRNAMTNYQTALANWKTNGSRGPAPAPPDPNQLYQPAINVNQYNAGIPGGTGSPGGPATTSAFQLSPAQAASMRPTSAAAPGSPAPATAASRRPTSAALPSIGAGGVPGGPAGATAPGAPGATRPGTTLPNLPQASTQGSPLQAQGPAPQQMQSVSRPVAANPAAAAPAVGGAPSSGPFPTYNPGAPTTPPNTGFVAPFGSGNESQADQINDPQGLTKQIVSSYDASTGRGNALQDQFKSYADQNAQRTAGIQGALATAYAPAAAGNGGYNPDQIAQIEAKPGLEALPTSAANLQKNFLTPEEQQQISWTPQNTQDLLDQSARNVGAGTQTQLDAVDRAAAQSGVTDPMAVQAMKNRTTQGGSVAAADAATNARIAAGQQQRQQAALLATNRQGVQGQNNQTHYTQGMDVNQLESGRAAKVADTNVAAGQEYRNNYLQGQEQQSNANTQAGNQQELNAFTSTNAGTNQANQVGVANQNTPTTVQRLLGFKRGGVAAEGTPEHPLEGPTPALVGEEYKPEAIVPIGPPYHAMADGGYSELDPQYSDPAGTAAAPAPVTTPQKRSALTNPSTYRNILTMGLSSVFPRFGAFGPLISGNSANGGSTNPNQPDKPAWQKAAEASAATLGRGNHFTDPSQPLGPSDANLADRAAGQSNLDEIMKYQPPGELAPMLFAAGANRPANRPSFGGQPSARPAPTTTGHDRPTSAAPPTWNPNIGQTHTPPPATAPRHVEPVPSPLPDALGHGYPSITFGGPQPTPAPPRRPVDTSSPTPPNVETVNSQINWGGGATGPEVPSYIPGPDTNIQPPVGYGDSPVSDSSVSGAVDASGASGGELDPQWSGVGYEPPQPPAPVIQPPSSNMWDPAPIAPPSGYAPQPGTGYPDTGGVSQADPGGFANAGSGWQEGGYGGGGMNPSELYPWFGSDNGLPSGNAEGAVYAPPQTRFGPTRVVNKPTYMTLGARQPEAVIPLTKKKSAKVRPSDVPSLVKRYGD